MKRIIYQDDDGLKIVIPAIEDIARVIEKTVPKGVEYEVVDVSEVPEDRTFRNAWKKNGKKIDIDIKKTKEIAHNVRRENRDKKLKPLDDEINYNITDKNKVKGIEDKRQKIRDDNSKVQTNIDNSKTVEKLKSIIETMKEE